jgi:hypothetical protein
MKFTYLSLLVFALLMTTWSSHAVAQDNWSVWRASGHVFSVMTFSYAGYSGYVKLWGTNQLPHAKGEIYVSRDSELASIDALVEDLPPASSFGIAFNTYVLWLVAPDGKLENAGVFPMHGDKGQLHAETTLDTWGMFVSAEPDCNVQAPSEVVVLVNTVDSGALRRGPAIIHYAHAYNPYYPAEN